MLVLCSPLQRKTHHQAWTGCQSSKERVLLPYNHMRTILQGHPVSADLFSAKPEHVLNREVECAQSIQDAVVSRKLSPSIGTSYWRCAFQDERDNYLRVTIDTGVRLTDARVRAGTCSGEGAVAGAPPSYLRARSGEGFLLF